ncbi:MAG: ABC transporter substrate-binding protein [Alteromonadaceae bacterium]|jgi:NitT/TauT family transport system substrate-binding protein|uniref:Sulfonate/nitrate/taurine transport system substrate-binding protein n=1 Tax=Paraglaciecola mesophila KMM 241 TaxID=1128912 RepID=K6Z9D4_9ALTE|nr:ABC transporter substrate-binding protein [Paraglaciecola mesophila]MAD15455.1 ABC transporter substrate-binding protein [Alteromonadaceae bacterium]MBB18087.1 ABC transporter substrate-binding protein [Rickettsiales bacterium]GAC25593.1 sulfonate/nitrate/taurine transport system substrate-binding protein [Paraglaciecola mesophila KMM 241]|tara:strand:- start:1520 stop:2560 length:1041 start_codon:yes stop_codon:yes gene_type:complete
MFKGAEIRRLLIFSLVVIVMAISMKAFAQKSPNVRLGVLKYGTVNWEVDVIKHHKLDKKYGFTLDVLSLGSKNASAVALQSDAVDIILTDWLWVNRQRANDKDITLFPTSIATGGLYVANDSPAKDVRDLANKRVGIAGGEVDKNWLLLQAYAKAQYGFDIKNETKPSFMSPVLLNVLMLRGELDAGINFWHYGARLKAKGHRLLVTVPEILHALHIENDVPLLGWAFKKPWAEQHANSIKGFLQASLAAKQILYSSDEEWTRIRGLTKAEDDEVFTRLQTEYRRGLLHRFGLQELTATKDIFAVLAQHGGHSLVGNATSLDEHTFYAFDQRLLSWNPVVEDESAR